MKLELTIHYRPSTLNVTKRQHWSKQYREQKRAWAALRSAIEFAVSDPSTPTALVPALKTALTVYDAADLFQVTIPSKFASRSSKNESATLPTNVLSLPSYGQRREHNLED